LASSFTDHLPWTSCDNWWNSEACRKFDTKNCTALGGIMNSTGACIFKHEVSNETWNQLNFTQENLKMPADEYFHNYMLDISEGIHEIGGIRWQLALCLLFAWVVVFFALLHGVKSFGKAVYFTAIFPYVVLVILLIRSATLPGYINGITFYVTPKWEKLLEAQVWGDAVAQIFYSLSPCWGGIITLASYMDFNNNCFRYICPGGLHLRIGLIASGEITGICFIQFEKS
jgi:solute carrier family 6 amino acid transporter-like protein 5/7/9/14